MVETRKDSVPQKQKGKKERITDAAIKVFAEKGFYQAKISEIAREASVADGTIYLYFNNKDDLLIHVFEVTMEYFIAELEARLESLVSPADKLEAFIQSHLEMVETYPDHAAVITIELRQSPKFMRDYKAVRFGIYLRKLADIVEEGRDSGLFRKDLIPWLTARALFGMLDEMALMWVLSRNFDLKESARVIHDVFLNGTLSREN